MVEYVQANGLNFALERRGSGEAVLFLGGTGWDLRDRPNPLDSQLGRHFNVYLFDQRGMGRSDKPETDYTMADYAEDAAAIMDAVGLETAHVIGYSFGGMVAQELAIRYPEKIHRLVLAATTSGGAGGASYPIHELQDLPPEEKARKSIEAMDRSFTPQWQADNPERAARMIRERMLLQNRRASDAALEAGKRRQLAARAQHDCYDRLNRITAPTLVLAGDRDGQAPVERVRNLATAIKGARMEIVPGAHGFLGETPQAYELMTAFLGEASVEHL